MGSATIEQTIPAAPHPLAGQEMTGADMIIQVLSDEGVDTVFGYSGGAILPTYDAVYRFNRRQEEAGDSGRPINLIVPANEQGAGFMAAGYSRSSGRIGVAMVTSGPGATNTVTPVRDSMADSIPMIVLCGQVPRAAMGTDAFQEAPVYNIMSTCAKHAFLVTDPEELEATIRAAFHIARTGRPGPVVVDLPKDVQNWRGKYRGFGMVDARGYARHVAEIENSRITEAHAARFFAMLKRSERPLIYAGGGIVLSGASDRLRAFAERFQIPVTTTLMGLGSIPSNHDLSMRMLGMHGTAYANYAVEDCDFLIALGARFDDRVAGKIDAFAPNCQAVAHIDIDASEISKVKPANWWHIGDMKPALEALLQFGASFQKDFSPWVAHIRRLREEYPLNYDRDSPLIQPQYVMERVNAITRGEAIIATGVGQHQMWAAQYGEYNRPRYWLTSGSMGTMGFGLPAAIGAQVANPDKTVIDVDGDGSLRMNLGELETATTYNIPVKVLLFNNLGDGMVRQWQRLYFGERFSGSDKSLHKKDFVKAAEADGYTFARRIKDPGEVDEALAAFLSHDGPAILEVMIDPDAGVFPIVGPGCGYKEMVTGEFINKREEPAQTTNMDEMPDLF